MLFGIDAGDDTGEQDARWLAGPHGQGALMTKESRVSGRNGAMGLYHPSHVLGMSGEMGLARVSLLVGPYLRT